MKKDSYSKYIQIYEQVRSDIAEGRYKKGTRLPSKRIMAQDCGVSVITVEHAYELLLEEGYITAREKSGFFVIYDENRIYAGNVKSTGEPQLPEHNPPQRRYVVEPESISPAMYAKTARRVLSEIGDGVMEKSPMQGVCALRQAIAGYLDRSRRIRVSPDQIIVGAGAEYLYGLIVQTFGREVIYGIESPSYQTIARVYEGGGATLQLLRLGRDGIESSELWKSSAKVLHITPYRSFPSGVTASATKKREYLQWSRQNNAIIVEDDFESEFTPSRKPEETLFSLDNENRVIYVNTFTRTIGSSVRAAYMVIPASMKEKFDEAVGFYACPVPTLEQYIIAGLIDNGDFERHINRVRRKQRTRNNVVRKRWDNEKKNHL